MSIYTLGIDVGSTASKCIILKDGKEIVAKSLVAVGTGTSGPARSISEVLENAHMKKEDMAFTLATGYGRNSLEGIADKQMSELSCHAMGASFIWPNVHTVIDIGGQDVKVIHVENGTMTNFQMYTIISNMTGGGPVNATTTLSLAAYKAAFQSYNFGEGAAIGVLWLVILVVVTLISNKLSDKYAAD